jgi:hypothetical protein
VIDNIHLPDIADKQIRSSGTMIGGGIPRRIDFTGARLSEPSVSGARVPLSGTIG